ncbi:MAG: zf-TFIIB domain-containing protein [Dehalococcoidales bacterium]|nr:zf-TFIIB domain-containing protein [Dehalococcoidales bacterium]
MLCPVCHKDALIVEYQDIELDYCPVCHGVWFDAGELELLMASAGFEDFRRYLDGIINAPETDTQEKKHKCPACGHKMKKAYIDPDSKILVDVCHIGEGIWFDGGEVTRLIQALAQKAPDKGPSQGVLAFVGDMFKYQE